MKITDSKRFDIRYTTLGDKESLMSFLNTKEMLHWYPPCDHEELESFVRVWMGFARYSASLTATYKKKPIGMATLYLLPYRKVAHQSMFQIVVGKEHQRKGVGRDLIRNLIHLAKHYFRHEMLSVEILDESGLIPILQSLGFVEFARQEKFVKDGENYYPRILMEKAL